MDEFINLLPIFLVFVIFYLVLYLPQRRRAKKHDEFIERFETIEEYDIIMETITKII